VTRRAQTSLAYDVIPYGDAAFLIRFDTKGYSAPVSTQIHALIRSLKKQPYWEELVPGYNSLLACFSPTVLKASEARAHLSKALSGKISDHAASEKVIEIPVCYGGEYGPDMEAIQKTSGLSETEIIERHSGEIYSVCMMGFVPGFTFLSEAPKELHHPRHTTPRAEVPAGSVGIAGWQTGIYGLDSPGGWQLIGRTPLKIFDGSRDEPFLLSAGNRIKFVPVSAEAFK